MCKVQRLSREGVQPSGWKQFPLIKSDDIVQSAWGHVAVHKRTVKELTSFDDYNVTYGMGRETFKHYAYDMYGIKFTDNEAKEMIGKFFRAYPGLKEYHNKVGDALRRGGYVCQTALGYKMSPKQYAEAINGPTQGTGGEVMRLAIHLLIKAEPEALDYLVNSIHDAAYLIVPEIDRDYWGKLLADKMQEAWYEIRKSRVFHYHDIPMNIDVMYGHNMGELEEDFAGGGAALTLDEQREVRKRNKIKATK